MSILATDNNSNAVQAFRLPVSGYTIAITGFTAIGSHPSGQIVNGGVYRIVSSLDVTLALGATATASDMPMRANQPEYFYLNAGSTVSAYNATAGITTDTVQITRMP